MPPARARHRWHRVPLQARALAPPARRGAPPGAQRASRRASHHRVPRAQGLPRGGASLRQGRADAVRARTRMR